MGEAVRLALGHAGSPPSLEFTLENNVGLERTFSGGMRVGSGFSGFNASVPLAELRATNSELRLSGPFGRNMVFPRTAVTNLSKHRGLFSVGVRIRHTIPEYDELVVFLGVPLQDCEGRFAGVGLCVCRLII